MKYDKTTIIGVAACLVLLVSWPYIARRTGLVQPAPPVQEQPTDVQPVEPTPEPPVEPAEATDPVAPPAADPGETAPTPGAGAPGGTAADLPEPVPGAQPETVVRQTSLSPRPLPAGDVAALVLDGYAAAAIDLAPGGINSVLLERYVNDPADDGETTPVELGTPAYPFCSLDVSALTESTTVVSSGVENGRARVVRTALEGRLEIVEAWTFEAGVRPYQMRYTVTLNNVSGAPLSIPALAVSAGALPPSTAPGRKTSARSGGGGGVMVCPEENVRPRGFTAKKIRKMDPREAAEMARTEARWLTVHSKYFLFHIAREDALFAGCELALVDPDSGPVPADADGPDPWHHARGFLQPVQLDAETPTVSYSFRAYAGPKKYALLYDMGDRVAAVMDMDRFLWMHPRWMEFLTRNILRALIWLNGKFNNRYGYGLAIICVTLLVKILFWPLTHKSTTSMRKMQALQPQLKELKETYKDNPQKLYRKQQELYKEHKVSPLGGCLPMFLQIPVFFALFNTFRSAIELRHSAFLWAADLSLPDTLAFSPESFPIRPLAAGMGISMLVQQKLAPKPADPSQARTMMFMSVFFIFIFYSMPSGLTLYWTVNQLLTIVQTLVTKKLEKRQPQPSPASRPA